MSTLLIPNDLSVNISVNEAPRDDFTKRQLSNFPSAGKEPGQGAETRLAAVLALALPLAPVLVGGPEPAPVEPPPTGLPPESWEPEGLGRWRE